MYVLVNIEEATYNSEGDAKLLKQHTEFQSYLEHLIPQSEKQVLASKMMPSVLSSLSDLDLSFVLSSWDRKCCVLKQTFTLRFRYTNAEFSI